MAKCLRCSGGPPLYEGYCPNCYYNRMRNATVDLAALGKISRGHNHINTYDSKPIVAVNEYEPSIPRRVAELLEGFERWEEDEKHSVGNPYTPGHPDRDWET